jgi:hypothetical protein
MCFATERVLPRMARIGGEAGSECVRRDAKHRVRDARAPRNRLCQIRSTENIEVPPSTIRPAPALTENGNFRGASTGRNQGKSGARDAPHSDRDDRAPRSLQPQSTENVEEPKFPTNYLSDFWAARQHRPTEKFKCLWLGLRLGLGLRLRGGRQRDCFWGGGG